MAYDDEDVKRFRKAEEKRSKKPPTPEEIYEERIKRLRDLRRYLELGDWELFRRALIDDYGLKEGTPQWDEARKIWNQYHAPRRDR